MNFINDINLIIDFDSTFIQDETIEILAEIALKKSPKRFDVLSKIKKMTNLAMNGELSFQEALKQRIQLINATQDDVNATIKYLQSKITPSFKNNIDFFKLNANNCYIISGGFKEIIFPIVKPFGINERNIFANTFIFNNNGIISIDPENPLSMDMGKVKVIEETNKINIILGDGFTDYEIKKFNKAKYFIQFAENINRKKLNNKADIIAKSFDEALDFIQTL